MRLFFTRPTPAVEKRSGLGIPAVAATGGYAGIDASNWMTSLQSVAVRASIDLLASLASELPVHIYQGDGSGRRTVPVPATLADPGADGHGLADWRYQAMVSWLSRGNLYGAVESRTPGGKLAEVSLMHPDDVRADVVSGGAVWKVVGKDFPRERMLHVRVNPVPGRLLGLSPLTLHATQVGLSLTSAQFGHQWFTDGAHPSSVLVNTEEEIDQPKATIVKDRYMASMNNKREPLVMGRGWELKPIQVTAEESQFLATQGATEAQCARIFGPGVAEILGYESGGNLTYANVDSRFAHLLVGTLDKWLSRLDRLMTLFLPDGQQARIDRDALLQTNTVERYKVHEIALRNWWKTINEIRAEEKYAPVAWGDEPYFTSKAFSEAHSISTSTSTSTVAAPGGSVPTGADTTIDNGG